MAWKIEGAHLIIDAGATARWRIRFGGLHRDEGAEFISVHPILPGRITMLEFSKQYEGRILNVEGYSTDHYAYWVRFRNDSNVIMPFYFEGY